MASSKDRQRQLARAKYDRQIARRAERARRRRQIRAGIAGLVVLLLAVGGGLWLSGVFDPEPPKPEAVGDCTWLPNPAPGVKDVGSPPTSGMAKAGVAPTTITTNLGVITAELDLAKAPCAGASFAHLAGKKFYDNTTCHRLSTANLFVLQCGSGNSDGTGDPNYQFSSEYLPQQSAPDPSASPGSTPAQVTYPAGTVALVNSGGPTNGSQFLIFYKDTAASPAYGIVGTVTQGLDLVAKAAEAGAVDAEGKKVDDGKPKNEITIQTLTVAAPTASTS